MKFYGEGYFTLEGNHVDIVSVGHVINMKNGQLLYTPQNDDTEYISMTQKDSWSNDGKTFWKVLGWLIAACMKYNESTAANGYILHIESMAPEISVQGGGSYTRFVGYQGQI